VSLHSVSRPEWRRVSLFIALVLLITTIPYAVGMARAGADGVFSGFVFGVEDGNSYLGKMRLGMRGQFDFTLFYTPEQHDAAPLINLPYIAAGWIAGRFVAEGSPASQPALVVTFHGFRLLADALLLLAMYRFIACFLRAPAGRMAALALASFAGGVGWLLALLGMTDLLGSLPADLYIPEGFSFQILFGLPHVALARALLLFGFVRLIAAQDGLFHLSVGQNLSAIFSAQWRLQRGVRLRDALLAGVCWLLVGVIVPFYLPVAYVVLAAWWALLFARRRRFPTRLTLIGAIAATVSLPALLYNAAVFARSPAFAQWSAQNQLPSPHPLHYLLAYGLIGLLAALAARAAWRRAESEPMWALPLAWVAVVPLLVYLPLNVQRRLAEGVIVPLAILAASTLIRRQRENQLVRAAPWVIAALSLTAAFLWFGGLLTALQPRPPAYIPAAYAAAFAWLNTQVTPDDVILAAVPTGNALPAFVRSRVYMGHGPETLFWQEKTATVEQFYAGTLPPDARRALFEPPCPRFDSRPCLLPVTYVIDGAWERELGALNSAGLTLVYEAAGVRVYVRDSR
jgi:hypothetical protein